VLVRDYFKGTPRLQFFHMLSSEIEWFKPEVPGPGAAEQADSRERLQRELATTADLAVAVGPRLHREIATLIAPNQHPRVLRFDPGIDESGPVAQRPPGFHVLILGRMEDEDVKGLDIAAKAIGIACEESAVTTLPIFVVRGARVGSASALRDKLRSIAQCPKLEIRIKEYSSSTELIAEDILRSSLVLLPSRAEGFGLSALEAISAGVPVLVSARSGCGELIREVCPQLHNRVVIPVSSDVHQDARLWGKEIEFILRAPDEAFHFAAKLRAELLRTLSWRHSVTQMLAQPEVNRR